MKLALTLITALLLTVPCLAKDLTYTDVPDPLVEEINDKVFTTIERYERENTVITDSAKVEALETKIYAIKERIKPTPVRVEPIVEPEPEPQPDPIAEYTINWSDTERIR